MRSHAVDEEPGTAVGVLIQLNGSQIRDTLESIYVSFKRPQSTL